MRLSTDPPLRRVSPAALGGFVLVALVRALTLPRTLWEMDEVLFARAVDRFDPLGFQPHPPGYPLLVGLGKLFNLAFHDPFASLIALSLVSSLVGYWALVGAFRRICGESDPPGDAERVAVAGALLFELSPAMLVQGPLPMSDPPALMFLALALLAAVVLRQKNGSFRAAVGLGAAASAAVGCRPQLALAVLPMLAMALWQAPGWRRRGEALAAFALVSLLWFVPLLVATGGSRGLLAYEMKQASYVAAHDATGARAGDTTRHVAKRFIFHPWGQKGTALPVLAAALTGLVALALRRDRRDRQAAAALPVAVLTAAQLAVCLTVMDPADAVRYALPVVLGVAFLAAVGVQALARRAKVPAALWLAPAAVAAAAIVYAWPLLAARTRTASPPVAAVRWLERHVPPKSVVLVDDNLAPHAAYLAKGFDLSLIEDGFHHSALRPEAQAWLYAEGESHWPGAVTFRWPESDAYHKLTRDHYRVVSLSPISLDHRFRSLRGIYNWEPSLLDARWRWLNADAAVQIFPRRSYRAVRVDLGLDPSAPLPSNTVTVSLAGAPGTPGRAVTVEIPRGARRAVELPLPGPGRFEIDIRSARSFIPGPRDSRRLAVQLLAVERIAR
jgi:hypothetical protein